MSVVNLTTKLHKTHLLLSIHPITFLLKPNVLAASNNLLCVPFNIFLWSTKLSNTSRPWDKNSSILVSVFCKKVCSSNALNSRLFRPLGAAPYGWDGVDVRNGDSLSSCCWGVVFGVFRKRRRASAGPAEGGFAPEDERSSVRSAASFCLMGV